MENCVKSDNVSKSVKENVKKQLYWIICKERGKLLDIKIFE